MNHRPPVLFVVAAVVLLGAGCGRAAPPAAIPEPLSLEETRTVAPPPTAPPTNEAPTTPPPGVPSPRVIRVAAKLWEFVPAEIRVRKGEQVILEVTSADVPHGLSIPAYNINRMLAPGVTERIAFTADKAGRFDFACSVVCGQGHRDMRGVLVVE